MPQQDSDPSTGGSPGSSLLGLLYLALTTASALWLLWESIPAATRARMTARLYRSSARATRTLARRTAAASMRNELATGNQQYEMPYWLAVQADHMDRRAADLIT